MLQVPSQVFMIVFLYSKWWCCYHDSPVQLFIYLFILCLLLKNLMYLKNMSSKIFLKKVKKMKNQNTSEFNKIKKMKPNMTSVHKIRVTRCRLFVEIRQVWLAAPKTWKYAVNFWVQKCSRIRIGSGSEKNFPVSPSYSSWPPF